MDTRAERGWYGSIRATVAFIAPPPMRDPSKTTLNGGDVLPGLALPCEVFKKLVG
jgi:hypothetical protein